MTEAQKKPRAGRIVATIAVGILPLLSILLGGLLLLGDAVVTVSFAITYIILPCAAFVLCFLEIRSKHHPAVKAILCVVLSVLVIVACLFLMTWGHFSLLTSLTGDKAVAEYREAAEQLDQMPEIIEVGEPENIEYHYFFNLFFMFFDSNCHMLFCQYPDSDYQQQKEQLEERYLFEEEPFGAHGYSIGPVVTMEGYEFRFLSFSVEEYGLYYPKYMMLVGTNDETNEVVYLYYSDDDLDYIDSTEEFFRDDCGWKYIR